MARCAWTKAQHIQEQKAVTITVLHSCLTCVSPTHKCLLWNSSMKMARPPYTITMICSQARKVSFKMRTLLTVIVVLQGRVLDHTHGLPH